MSAKTFFGENHVVKGLDAVANAFAGTVTSDVVNMKDYQLVRFYYHKGVGATGTATLTVEACDDAAGNNPTAIPFVSQSYVGATNTDDTAGAVTSRAAAGFNTTAGSSQLYVIEADTQRMGAQKWIRLKSVEVVASAVLGGIIIEQCKPRFPIQVPPTTIA